MCQTVKLFQQTDLSGCHHVYLFSQYDPQTIGAFILVIVCKGLVSASPHFENQYKAQSADCASRTTETWADYIR